MCGERSAFFSDTVLISIASGDLIFTRLALPALQRCVKKGVCSSPARS